MPSPKSTKPAPTEKLQKVLADRGLGGRRQMERWIADGRVTVDGETAHIGQRITATAVIAVDGKKLRAVKQDATRVLVLNKAIGTICTRSDPEGRKTVFDGLPKLHQGRWVAVGRLDVQTSGLLLLTNDGALANKMMHPSTGLDREYAVRVDGRLTDEEVEALLNGVLVEGEHLRFSDLQHYDGRGRNHWYHAVLMEGKHHEVRNLFAAVGRAVSRLKRVRYGPVILPSGLPSGRVMEVEEEEVGQLCRLVGVPFNKRPPSRKRNDKKAKSVLLPYPELRAQNKTAE